MRIENNFLHSVCLHDSDTLAKVMIESLTNAQLEDKEINEGYLDMKRSRLELKVKT